jgi:hypothetical protein
VQAGQQVSAGEQIATFVPGGSIEIGFADSQGAPLASPVYSEGDVTAWGRRMAAFLANPSTSASGFGELPASTWNRLIGRLGQIENPEVPTAPSRYSLPDKGGKKEPTPLPPSQGASKGTQGASKGTQGASKGSQGPSGGSGGTGAAENGD